MDSCRDLSTVRLLLLAIIPATIGGKTLKLFKYLLDGYFRLIKQQIETVLFNRKEASK